MEGRKEGCLSSKHGESSLLFSLLFQSCFPALLSSLFVCVRVCASIEISSQLFYVRSRKKGREKGKGRGHEIFRRASEINLPHYLPSPLFSSISQIPPSLSFLHISSSPLPPPPPPFSTSLAFTIHPKFFNRAPESAFPSAKKGGRRRRKEEEEGLIRGKKVAEKW